MQPPYLHINLKYSQYSSCKLKVSFHHAIPDCRSQVVVAWWPSCTAFVANHSVHHANVIVCNEKQTYVMAMLGISWNCCFLFLVTECCKQKLQQRNAYISILSWVCRYPWGTSAAERGPETLAPPWKVWKWYFDNWSFLDISYHMCFASPI